MGSFSIEYWLIVIGMIGLTAAPAFFAVKTESSGLVASRKTLLLWLAVPMLGFFLAMAFAQMVMPSPDVDPDEAARVLELSRQSGQPVKEMEQAPQAVGTKLTSDQILMVVENVRRTDSKTLGMELTREQAIQVAEFMRGLDDPQTEGTRLTRGQILLAVAQMEDSSELFDDSKDSEISLDDTHSLLAIQAFFGTFIDVRQGFKDLFKTLIMANEHPNMVPPVIDGAGATASGNGYLFDAFWFIGMVYLFYLFRIITRRARDTGQTKTIAYVCMLPVINVFCILYLLFKPQEKSTLKPISWA